MTGVAGPREAAAPAGWVRESAHFDRPVTPLFATTVLPAIEEGHRAASRAHGGASGLLRLRTVDGWVYAALEPTPAASPAGDAAAREEAPDVFALVEGWERGRVPEVHARVERMRGLAREGLPARRVAAELEELQRHLGALMRLHYETGFAAQGAAASLEGFLAARGDPAPALTVATLLSPCDSLLREVDRWLAAASEAHDPVGHARGEPLWSLARDRPSWLDLDAPTWGEDPEALARALRRAGGRAAFEAGTARALAARARAEEGALARFPPEAHASVRAVLDALRRARGVQQTLNFLVGEVGVGVARHAWRRAGAALASVGLLRATGEVVWLTREEALGALRGEPLPRGLVAERREAWARARASPPPEVLGEVDAAVLGDPRTAALLGHRQASEGLRGLGASPGVARGPARVVATEEDAEALRPGEVLVVASLLPTWTSLMQRAAGIVTETGGMLSHGAVVARELGVPAVVGVSGATRRLRSGEEVRIDGASGEVAIEKRAFST